MCRMTEEHVRGNKAIWRPGKYLVCREPLGGGEYYVRIPSDCSAHAGYVWMRPKYAINVRFNHNPQHLMCDA
jgi:hypothetical protein